MRHRGLRYGPAHALEFITSPAMQFILLVVHRASEIIVSLFHESCEISGMGRVKYFDSTLFKRPREIVKEIRE